MKKNAFFVRARKLSAHVERSLLYYLLKIVPTASCTEPLAHVSFRDHPHNLSVCLSALSNSSSATGLCGQLLHLSHTHTLLPPPLPARPMHIHHNYAQQEIK